MGDEEEVRLTLRLPASLRDRLVKATTVSHRSMNAEMVARLEHSFVGSLLSDSGTLEEILENQLRQTAAALEFLQAEKD